jgi:hypothetical protein
MFELVKAFRDALGIDSTWSFVAIVALIGALITGGVAWIVDRAFKNALARESAIDKHADKRGPDPIIELDFSPMAERLPLAIPPRGSIHVLSITATQSGYQAGILETRNNSHTTPTLWPTESSGPGTVTLRTVDTLRLSNHGDTTAFNVALRLKVLIGADNLPMGKQFIDVETRRATLPVGGQPHVIYALNRTDTAAMVWLPSTVTVRAQGDPEPRTLPLRLAGMIMPVGYTDPATGEKWVGGAGVSPSGFQR